MPRYLVQRTFPEGLHIPTTNDGAKTVLGVVDGNSRQSAVLAISARSVALTERV